MDGLHGGSGRLRERIRTPRACRAVWLLFTHKIRHTFGLASTTSFPPYQLDSGVTPCGPPSSRMTTSPGFSWIDCFLANCESIDSSGRARAEPRRSREPARAADGARAVGEEAVARRAGARAVGVGDAGNGRGGADALGSVLRAGRELQQVQHDSENSARAREDAWAAWAEPLARPRRQV